jgi:hypothetical protein
MSLLALSVLVQNVILVRQRALLQKELGTITLQSATLEAQNQAIRAQQEAIARLKEACGYELKDYTAPRAANDGAAGHSIWGFSASLYPFLTRP